MKVMKFGGSSVADSEQMLKVFDIINNTKDKKIVVLSACKDITNKLEKVANLSVNKSQNTVTNTYKERDNILNSIIKHHTNIANSTLSKYLSETLAKINNLSKELNNIIAGISLLNELTPATKDSVLAFGEILSSTIFHFICKEKGINNTLLDARDLIFTNNNYNEAIPDIIESKNNIIKAYSNSNTELIITQGFIGSYNEGIIRKTTTLGRGGSDYSAAIIGAILNAEEIIILTDVNGILSADPKHYKETFTINEMSFNEIKDLAFFGAKVLHPKTLLPAINKNINIKVKNTFNPNNPGTLITLKSNSDDFMINSVIAKENCTLYVETKPNFINENHNFPEQNDNFINQNDNNLIYSGTSNGNYVSLFEKNNNLLNENNNLLNKNNSNEKNSTNKNTISDNKNMIPCSVICISGANFTKNIIQLSNFLSNLKCFANIEVLQLIFEFSFNSILIVTDSKAEIHQIVEAIHKQIIRIHNI